MAQGRPLSAKLFLEGIEVPFIGATVTSTVGQASIAYIDLVPHSSINNIKPRTLVHLFVKDFTRPNPPYPYVLAFEGEVFGFSFGRSADSRSFSISCIDVSGYWDNVLTYFFNAHQTLGKMDQLAAIGMDIEDAKRIGARIQKVTNVQSSYFRQIIEEVLKDKNKDFLDGFVEVIKRITEVNAFYKLADDRLKLKDRIVLKSSGTLSQLLQADEGLKWFEGIIGKQSGYTTLRAVIMDLMSLIFHDFISIPFPAGNKKKVDSFIFKPNMYMLPPPACNIFFPDEYSSFQYSRNFFQEPTRLIYKPEMPRAFSDGTVALPHVYQPDSFANYMIGTKPFPSFKGDGDLQVDEDYGFFGDDNTDEFKASSVVKREQQFLTNEEKLRGIWIAQEGMVPASSQFRAALTDFGKRRFADRVSRYLFFKKRFQPRSIQVTSHLKPSVLPGFPVLILDDSEADQNVIAYCSSVTHRIYATQGGYTNTTLSYARTVTEQDSSSNLGNDPLVPPWFETDIFGSVTVPPESEAAKNEVKAKGKTFVGSEKLAAYYQTLLGSKGFKPLTSLFKSEPTPIGAVRRLLKEYRSIKAAKGSDVQTFISKYTARDYVVIESAFGFLGATSSTKDMSIPFVEFKGERLLGKGKPDENQIKLRRFVIEQYRNQLKQKRGFRG